MKNRPKNDLRHILHHRHCKYPVRRCKRSAAIHPIYQGPVLNTLLQIKLAIIGLGYVGLPLAVEFGKQRSVVGFDINQKRIDQLKAGHDFTLETEPEELQAASHLQFSTDIEDLRGCNVYIVTVPTPIDDHKRPDLTPLIKASETVGKVLKAGDIVIYPKFGSYPVIAT